MAAYIRFYQFDASPFGSGKAKPGVVLGTKSLRGALAKVKQGLAEDSPRICLTGSSGVGKTSFCRALPKLLADSAQVAVVLDPSKPWTEVRATIAKRFGLQGGAISRKALLAARESSKHLILVIDQAQTLSHKSLDHLDILLQYKCDDGKQLLHCVILANLDAAAAGTEIPLLWWLDKFTTLQLQFSPIPAEGLRHYVEKHLAKAGWAGGELFTAEALLAIHRNTGGVPRAINELCEKILVEGGIHEINSISADFIERLCGDSPDEITPTADPETSANPSSVGEFGPPMTAQEMLDDCALGEPPPEVGTRGAREQQLEPAEDIASLLITQDSSEMLQVAGDNPRAEKEHDAGSPGLELENEPAKSPQSDFHDQENSVGAPIGMGRVAFAPPSRRRSVPMVVSLAVAAALAYALYSQVPVPTKLIESAEVKIAEVIKKQTRLKPKEQVEPAKEVAKKPSLASSILDRVDKLVSDTKLNIVKLPESEETLPDAEPNTEWAGDLAEESEMEAKTEPAAGPTKPQTASTTIRISSEPIVVNEYTAVPDSASSPAKPSTPAKIAPEATTEATTPH